MPRKSKSRKSRKSRKSSDTQRAKKYIVKALFKGNRKSADAFISENDTTYEKVRALWTPGTSKEFLAHSLWLKKQQEGWERRNPRSLSSRDTAENAWVPVISRQMRNVSTNQTMFF